jgi:hypothetical protein
MIVPCRQVTGIVIDRLRFVIVAAIVGCGTAHALAQQPPAGGAVPTAPKATARSATHGTTPGGRLLPGTRGNILSTIQGNALNSSNGALAANVVRLRDARFGRVIDSQLTDRSGLFAFRTIDPGSYIVELMGHDQTVLAASQIIDVNAGDAVTAIVKLPFRIPPFAGVLGNTAPSAAAVTTEAAASGILATTVAGTETSNRTIF